ncbi:MAG: GNAT family N-acetyltransferase [Candidatus Bathyarchaeota archaeon]|nr:GNAT family N-acetyltransferase [Candidatus Bathyarchaeota archaeon]MDH5687571.1 GNAT family N-acetyltransferase [Candidatus Bathyarchaeota archaeon]
MKLERIGDTHLDHREYLEFINDANRDNVDWVPFGSVESLRTFLFLYPDYDPSKHLAIIVNKAIVADLFMKIHSVKPVVAEIALNIARDWRRRGLGERLLSTALGMLDQSIDVIRIILSPGNREILQFAKDSSFTVLTQVDFTHDLRLIEPVHTPPGYNIQPVKTDQLEEVTFLRNQIFGTVHREEELKTLIEEGAISTNIIIATVYGEVVGYCIGEKDTRTPSKEGLIAEIGVKQEHRRKGIGKAMLLMNLDWLKSKGCNRVTINSKSDNTRALRLYEASGFNILRVKEKIAEKSRIAR